MNQEKETIDGFDIEKRELTDEEKSRDITLDVINEFHYNAGEDLLDQVGYLIKPHVLGGYLMHKRLNIAKVLIKAINEGDALSLKHAYEKNDLTDDEFYSDFREFINLTTDAKARFNQVLIQVNEYYKD